MAKFMIALVVCGLLAAGNALPRSHSGLFPDKIVGGEDAKQGELPYQIQLQRSGSHYCGGSLVVVNNKQVVVSAAHCLGGSPSTYTVVAGELKRSQNSGLEQSRKVTKIDVHEQYSSGDSYKNDIGLLHIESDFELNDNVQPIALPSKEQQTSGSILVSGWGNTQGGNNPDTLQKVELPVVSDADCQKAYQGDETIHESQLCAGLLGEGGKDSCQGDSGGPLRALSGNYLAGVVSWGYGCAEADYPGVNTEVSYFIDWINSHA